MKIKIKQGASYICLVGASTPISAGRNTLLIIFLCLGLVLINNSQASTVGSDIIDSKKVSEVMLEGDKLRSLGQVTAAIQLWSAAVKQQNDSEQLALLFQRIGVAYQSLFDNDAALRAMIKANIQANKSGRLALQYRIQASLASIYLSSGQLGLAKKQFEVSLGKAINAGDQVIQAEILSEYGGLLSRDGTIDKALNSAIDKLKQSQEISKRLALNDLQIRNLVRLATVAVKMHDRKKFDQYVEHAILLISNNTDQQANMRYRIHIGELMVAALGIDVADDEHIQKIYIYLNKVLFEVTQQNHLRGISMVSATLASLYRHTGQVSDAELLFARAIFAAQESGDNELLYRWQWQLARLALFQGDINLAVKYYVQAQSAYNNINTLFTHTYLDPSLLVDSPSVFHYEYADALLQLSDQQTTTEKSKALLIRARDSIEALKSVELQDYFKDSCVADMQAGNASIGDYSEGDALILYPILFSDRLDLLVSYRGEIARYSVAVKRDDIVDAVLMFRKKLEKRRSREYQQISQQLYQWLIKPIWTQLNNAAIKTLVIVPDVALRALPFAALHDGQHFLVETTSIVSLPGLTLTARHGGNREIGSVLLSGLTESVQGYPALLYVRDELHTIDSLYSSKVLVDNSFRADNIQKMFSEQEFTIAHFASHAEFNHNVNESFILTYDNKIGVDDLSRYMGLSRFRTQPVDLITLSACSTAVGDDKAALGLAGLTVKAGARSALATLWGVNDKVTTAIMTAFYTNLRNASLSKAESLQLAQKQMLSDKRYRHPGLWAPFILVGNWK